MYISLGYTTTIQNTLMPSSVVSKYQFLNNAFTLCSVILAKQSCSPSGHQISHDVHFTLWIYNKHSTSGSFPDYQILTLGCSVSWLSCIYRFQTTDPDAARAQGRCAMRAGIAIILIGTAFLALCIAFYFYLAAIAAVVTLWGAMLLLIALSRFRLANHIENHRIALPAESNDNLTTVTTPHTTVTDFRPTNNPPGFHQRQQFAGTPYVTRIVHSPPGYPPESQDSRHGMYVISESDRAPPSYAEATVSL